MTSSQKMTHFSLPVSVVLKKRKQKQFRNGEHVTTENRNIKNKIALRTNTKKQLLFFQNKTELFREKQALLKKGKKEKSKRCRSMETTQNKKRPTRLGFAEKINK